MRTAPGAPPCCDASRAWARRPAFWIGLTAAITAAEIVALTSIVFAAEPVPGYRALFRLVGGVFAVCGVIGWRLRP